MAKNKQKKQTSEGPTFSTFDTKAVPSENSGSFPLDIWKHIASFTDFKTLIRSVSLVCKSFRNIVFQNSIVWKDQLVSLFQIPAIKIEEPPKKKQKKTKSKQTKKSTPKVVLPSLLKRDYDPSIDYYSIYLDLMRNCRKKYKFEEEDVCLAEDEGEILLTIDFFGDSRWKGFANGTGRAGESWVENKLWGSGRLVLTYASPKKNSDDMDVSDLNLSVIGEETFEEGERAAIEQTSQQQEDDEEVQYEQEREIISTQKGEVTYKLDVQKGVITGGNFVHRFIDHMEW